MDRILRSETQNLLRIRRQSPSDLHRDQEGMRILRRQIAGVHAHGDTPPLLIHRSIRTPAMDHLARNEQHIASFHLTRDSHALISHLAIILPLVRLRNESCPAILLGEIRQREEEVDRGIRSLQSQLIEDRILRLIAVERLGCVPRPNLNDLRAANPPGTGFGLEDALTQAAQHGVVEVVVPEGGALRCYVREAFGVGAVEGLEDIEIVVGACAQLVEFGFDVGVDSLDLCGSEDVLKDHAALVAPDGEDVIDGCVD